MEKVQPTGSTNQKVLFTETICTTVYTLYTVHRTALLLVHCTCSGGGTGTKFRTLLPYVDQVKFWKLSIDPPSISHNCFFGQYIRRPSICGANCFKIPVITVSWYIK